VYIIRMIFIVFKVITLVFKLVILTIFASFRRSAAGKCFKRQLREYGIPKKSANRLTELYMDMGSINSIMKK